MANKHLDAEQFEGFGKTIGESLVQVTKESGSGPKVVKELLLAVLTSECTWTLLPTKYKAWF